MFKFVLIVVLCAVLISGTTGGCNTVMEDTCFQMVKGVTLAERCQYRPDLVSCLVTAGCYDHGFRIKSWLEEFCTCNTVMRDKCFQTVKGRIFADRCQFMPDLVSCTDKAGCYEYGLRVKYWLDECLYGATK